MTPSEERIRSAVALQAGEWFVAHRAGPLDEADRAAFVDWLMASPVHVEEYLGIALVARDLATVASDHGVPLESILDEARADQSDNVVTLTEPIPVPDPPVTRSWTPRAWPLAASAAAAAVMLIAWVLWWGHEGELASAPQTYATAHGEQSEVQLPDGSVMRLNTDSAATLRYSGAERAISVERGQALFQVAHDSERPFRVAAGDAQVLAIGTRFEVYRKSGNNVLVTVIDGAVNVFIGNPPATRKADLSRHVLRVGAGQQARIEAGIMPSQPVPVNLQETLAWLDRKLSFEHRPLGEVADEFNRYAQIPFQIQDPALRALPISGVFDADDTDSFAAFLETLDGVAVERASTGIRVVGRHLPD